LPKTIVGQKPATTGFQVVTPQDATQSPNNRYQPGATSAPASGLTATAIAQRLQTAEDKAVSAANLQQSAQTQEDWKLVCDRWRVAIQTLQGIANKSPAVQQKLAQYQNALAQATRQAQTGFNPSLNAAPSTARSAGGKPLILVPGSNNSGEGSSGPKQAAASPEQQATPQTNSPTAGPTAAPTPASQN
jgi:hypothetical protein